MASLEEYLKGQFLRDNNQIRIIDDLVDEVIPVFARNFGNSDDGEGETWPYDVTEDAIVIKKFSFSTHSMISFALDALTQRPFDSALISDTTGLRKLGVSKPDRKELMVKLRTAKQVLIEKLRNEPDPFVTSSTYGPNDPLTLTWLAELAHRCKAGPDNIDPKDLADCKGGIYSAAKQVFRRHPNALLSLDGDDTKNEIEHSFLKVRCLHLAKAVGYLKHKHNPPKTRIDRKSLEVAVHSQLGYFAVPDSRFDPAELVFATEGVLQFDRFGLNRSTIERIFAILEETQEDTPYWRPVAPFLGSKQGMVLFPVSVEIVNSLLRICGILDEKHYPAHFSQIEPMLRRYADWVIARMERFQGKNGPVAGWHSEHVNERGQIHLWETSQVLLFLAHYTGMLKRKIAADGREAAGISLRLPEVDIDEFEEYFDDEPLKSLKDYSVLGNVEDQFIKKRNSREGDLKPGVSMLVYGPPGTGKTTLAEQLAQRLDRPLIVITVSDFLAAGAAEIEARAKGVFDVLRTQEEVVILFDEIDQFLLDRNSRIYRQQSDVFKFMTPGMLTKLQALRESKNCVFIIATNYYERIDSAIKRRGRIDERYLLCVPDQQQRTELLKRFVLDLFKERLKNIKTRAEYEAAAGKDGEPREFFDDICAGAFTKIDFDEEIRKAEVLKKTTLYGWGDLKNLIDSKTKIIAGMTIKSLAAAIAVATQLVDPSVELSAYRGRLQSRDEPPLEEFFLLVYLYVECEKEFTGPEKQVVHAALERVHKDGGGELNYLNKFVKDHGAYECIVKDQQVEELWKKVTEAAKQAKPEQGA